MSEPYRNSVTKVIKDHVRTLPFMHRRTPDWLVVLLHRLPAAVSAKHPVEVHALCGLNIQEEPFTRRLHVFVRLLVQRGWSVAMSLQMYRNFKLAFPSMEGYEPEGLSLMTQKQLKGLFGETFGHVLGELFADPEAQPVFSALLRKQHVLHYRPCYMAGLKLEIDEVYLEGAEQLRRCPLEFEFGWVEHGMTGLHSLPRALNPTEAAEIYRDVTGSEPELSFNLSPYEIDYEALAQTAEEVRQADGDWPKSD